MTTPTPSVLVVEDHEESLELLARSLEERGFHVLATRSAEEALKVFQAERLDAVLTDVRLGSMDGLTLCDRINRIEGAPPVILMTAYGETDLVVGAMRAECYDFVTKPVEIDEIEMVLRRAALDYGLQKQVERLTSVVDRAGNSSALMGRCRRIRDVDEIVTRVAPSDATVLITGESGSGKELVARAIHDRSNRTGKFLAINCAAMPAHLLESELFGHDKGAFTGARSARRGLFVAASGGTLLLDEIAEMPAEMQVSFLRALQEKKIRPVGSDSEVEVDTRIIAATNINLADAVESGRFRQDLYYRINVVHIAVPPLRERGDDILLLAQHFISRAADRLGRPVVGLSADAAAKLLHYNWPGNVRELENAMERGVTLSRHSELTTSDLPTRICEFGLKSVPGFTPPPGSQTLRDVERQYISYVLERADGNKTQAAKVLGIDRRTLYRRMRALDIEEPRSDLPERGDPRPDTPAAHNGAATSRHDDACAADESSESSDRAMRSAKERDSVPSYPSSFPALADGTL